MFDSIWLFAAFAALLAPVVLFNARSLFLHKHARRHRLVGLVYVCFLVVFVGSIDVSDSAALLFAVDVMFGVLGCYLTYTAAFDFEKHHKRVDNRGKSGTLDDDKTVTHAEMLEHLFYQVVNLACIAYLHVVVQVEHVAARALLCLLATLPWLVRDRFPVHSFSQNYDGQPLTVTAALYRAKKYQYVLLKHALIHGLNVSAVFAPAGESWPAMRNFRLYWLALNASYVFEFFLQTLVKRRHLQQWKMLLMHAPLMVFATVTAVQTLLDLVSPVAALTSFALNMAHRKHDVVNTCIVLCVVWASRSE